LTSQNILRGIEKVDQDLERRKEEEARESLGFEEIGGD